jgi:hypothetical protein
LAGADPGSEPNRDLAPAEDLGQRIRELAARHREFVDGLAERQSLMIPAEDPDFEDLGPAFPLSRHPRRGAILRPPPPEIRPSELTMERLASRERDIEADA